MSILAYERDSYQKYLGNLTKEGMYQDYENAIYEMNELRKQLKEKGFKVRTLIDQVDNIYYGDIMFAIPEGVSESNIYFRAGRIIGELVNAGVIEPKINDSCIYFNESLHAIMYTMVAIKAVDGPDLYAQGTRTFVIR